MRKKHRPSLQIFWFRSLQGGKAAQTVVSKKVLVHILQNEGHNDVAIAKKAPWTDAHGPGVLNATDATRDTEAAFRRQLRSQHTRLNALLPNDKHNLRAEVLRVGANDVQKVRLYIPTTRSYERKETTSLRRLQQVPAQPEMQIPYEDRDSGLA